METYGKNMIENIWKNHGCQASGRYNWLEPPATKNWEAEMAARASTLQHPGKQLMFFHELTLRINFEEKNNLSYTYCIL